MAGSQGRVWVDDRAPDPTWPPPSRVPSAGEQLPTGGQIQSAAPAGTGRRRRRPHPVLVGATVAALVLGLVWAFGGFGQRTDLRIPTEPGRTFVTGPYEFTFSRATAQRTTRFGRDPIVEVKVSGMGRTTGDVAIAPSSLNPMFVARDPASGEVQEYTGQRFGPGAGFDHGDTFTPGLPPVEYTVTFEFSPEYRPGATLLFGVAQLEYTDTTLLGTGEKSWNNADRQFAIDLPVTQLPDGN